MDQISLRRAGRSKLLLAVLVLFLVFAAEVAASIAVFFLRLSDDSLMGMLIPEAAGALAAAAGIWALGGRAWLSTSREDLRFTFTFGWWCIAISLGLMVIEFVEYFYEGTPVSAQWASQLALVAVVCLFIGLFEELVFRGIVLNGLLAVLGRSFKGVVISIAITSLLFGAAHVDFSLDYTEPLSLAQALLKITQTGLYSLLLCTTVLRMRKLGAAALFHGFDDFVIIFPSVAFFDEALTTEYVTTGSDAVPAIVYYLVIIGLYLPFSIKAVRELLRHREGDLGAFMEAEVASASAGGAAVAPLQATPPLPEMVQVGPVPPTSPAPAEAIAMPVGTWAVPQPIEGSVSAPVTDRGGDGGQLREIAVPLVPPDQPQAAQSPAARPQTAVPPKTASMPQVPPQSTALPRSAAPVRTPNANRDGRPPAPMGL